MYGVVEESGLYFHYTQAGVFTRERRSRCMVRMTSTGATNADRERTTVSVHPSTKHALFRLKERQADTFDDVIQRLIERHESNQRRATTLSDLETENSPVTPPRKSETESDDGLFDFT
jgi:predicted CopG family antitoxin